MNVKRLIKIMVPVLTFGLLIICFLYQIRKDEPYCFSLDASAITQVEVFYNGTTYSVLAPYNAQIVDNFNSLTLHHGSSKLSGYQYRVSFRDEAGQLVFSELVLSKTHLLGREVIDGAIDMDLLQAACQAGTAIE